MSNQEHQSVQQSNNNNGNDGDNHGATMPEEQHQENGELKSSTGKDVDRHGNVKDRRSRDDERNGGDDDDDEERERRRRRRRERRKDDDHRDRYDDDDGDDDEEYYRRSRRRRRSSRRDRDDDDDVSDDDDHRRRRRRHRHRSEEAEEGEGAETKRDEKERKRDDDDGSGRDVEEEERRESRRRRSRGDSYRRRSRDRDDYDYRSRRRDDDADDYDEDRYRSSSRRRSRRRSYDYDDYDRYRSRRRRTRSRSRSRDYESEDEDRRERRRSRDRRKRKSGWDEVSPEAAHFGLVPPPGIPVPGMFPPGMIPPVMPPGMMVPPGMMPFNPQMQQQMMAMMQQQQQQMQHQIPMQTQLPTQPKRHNFNPETRVYVGNINFELSEDDIRKTFSPFGEIDNVVMSHDPSTGKHRGFCFIDFKEVDAAQKALQIMNGFELGGRQLKVNRPNNPPDHTTSTPSLTPTLPTPPIPGTTPTTPASDPIKAVQEIANKINAQTSRPSGRVYVGSVHWEITEDQLTRVFSPFGTILSCVLIPNPETGRHKGYGFIEFSTPQEAQDAIKHMDGFELGGRNLKVGAAIGGAGAGLSSQMRLQQPRQTTSLSQEENLTVSSNQRYLIMQKLAKSRQKPTRCLLLLNMVGPEDVDQTLEEELMSECNKFGAVEKLTIYQEKQSERDDDVIVKIFVLFQTTAACKSALQVMDGRFFGGRQIQAEYFDEEKFARGEYSS